MARKKPRRNAAAPAGSPPPAPAVFPDGRRYDASQMAREVSGPTSFGVRNIQSGHPAQGLTPQRLGALLRSSEEGDATAYLELAEEMEEKDLHYLGVMQTRKRAVAQLPIDVVAADDSAEAEEDAQLVRAHILERDALEAELFDILDATGKGYSVTEILWRLSSNLWTPERLKWRDPRWFEFDQVDGETLLLKTTHGPVPLAAAKYIVHQHQAKSGITIRGGLARAAAWGYLFKNYGMKDWVAFLDAYGSPLRVGRYDNGANEKDIRFLMQAVSALGSDAAAVFPKSMDVQFIDGKQGTAPEGLWKALAVYIDDQVSKAVLGQTNTTDAKAGGLGSGQANVHNEVRGDIERHDAKLLAATLNRDLVVPFVMMNRGQRARYPRLVIGRPEEHDVKALTDAVQALVPMGLKVGVKTIRERVGLPEPEEGEEVLTAPAAEKPAGGSASENGPQGSEKGETPFLGPVKRQIGAIDGEVEQATASASSAGGSGEDAIDWLADAHAADWQPLLGGAIDEIEQLLASSADVAELEAGLAQLGVMLPTGELAGALARASFVARLAGDAAVTVEQQQDAL